MAMSIGSNVLLFNHTESDENNPKTLKEVVVTSYRNKILRYLSAIYVIPLIGPTLEAGYYLGQGDYLNFAVSLSWAVLDFYTFGTASSLFKQTGKVVGNISIKNISSQGVKTLGTEAVGSGAKTSTSIWSSTNRLSSVKNAFKHWKDHGV